MKRIWYAYLYLWIEPKRKSNSASAGMIYMNSVWRVSSKPVASAPPIQDAQLFSVGRFHLGHPQSTRGVAQFYVCQPPPVLGAVLTHKSHTLPSLLTKLLQTLTLWHTQIAFHGNNLCVCRIRRFCYRLAEANHEVCVLSHTTL